jgi:hypothetical protein
LTCSLPLFALWNPKIRSFEQTMTEQRKVVSAYCRLDFQGGRLTPEGWERMSNLTTFRENPDFNSFFIVSRYQLIDNPTPTANVDVAYVVIGRFEEGAGYMPMTSSVRNVSFEMRDQNGELRIDRIEPTTPFVSRAAAINWLKTLLTTQKDPTARAQIEAAIQAMEAPSKSAPPSK